jgi:hypothetical protein
MSASDALVGKQSGDYFLFFCSRCDTPTKNEYLGWDPAVPHFSARCPKCGHGWELKLQLTDWEGLPTEAQH